MNERRKSDRSVVPEKSSNKIAPEAIAEGMEGRGLAKGNPVEQNTSRIQSRQDVSSALERVRQAAIKDRKLKFTSLLHHVYNPETLSAAYWSIKRQAAPGIDGQTWKAYGENLEDNLLDLSARLKRGAYRAKPVRRVYIPKTDGRLRPLCVPVLEDKIVQRAAAQVLNADIRGFFDAIDHGWMARFIEHRIADKRVVHLIQKWLKAGVLEDGERIRSEEGTPQGGSISPLLANVYLHYVFDLWIQQWRKRNATGDMIVVRFADDFIVGFEHGSDAERFFGELVERFRQFALELHPDKTRLIEFGQYAARNRKKGGRGKPETFDFLGFTHVCGKTRNGRFTVLRRTMRKRMQAKLRSVKEELRHRMHRPVPEVGQWLRSVVQGHMRYYAVPMNTRSVAAFRFHVVWHWWRSLKRRSQTHRMTWERMKRLVDHWMPAIRVCHPYPLYRLGVITQGRSPVR